MRIAIFLGAGASAAEGAPLQNKVFYEYFNMLRRHGGVHKIMEKELHTFFLKMFDINVIKSDLDKVVFPTFEEALGILDLAERKRETLKNFDLENIANNSNRIRFIRQYLILLMAKVLHDKLRSSNGLHKRLVDKLKKSGQLKNTVFISTNYDILIDNALTSLYPQFMIDYGVDFVNFNHDGDWKRPTRNSVDLLKLHGSLNWLYCPTCNTLELTPKEKGVIRLLTDLSHSKCNYCGSVIVPIIIPPTFYKDMSNIFLSILWHKAELAMRDVEHIVFCGYSFPDADMHIKYLLKRVQTNCKHKIHITVINNHPGKQVSISNLEKERYSRFLGKHVNYTNKSFEDFCNAPQSIIANL
ncbi:MAG: SIR2 family protein [bacterium]|nr:SIR2 family protein [bacterium]